MQAVVVVAQVELTRGEGGGREAMAITARVEKGSIASMAVQVTQVAQVGGIVGAGVQGGGEGPKWETDDGRVVQRIWQREGCFAPGNRFLLDTMGLTTGRLVAIIDENVFKLCVGTTASATRLFTDAAQCLVTRLWTAVSTFFLMACPLCMCLMVCARYGPKIEAWCYSMGLKLESVVSVRV